jgi:hypothetical protein
MNEKYKIDSFKMQPKEAENRTSCIRHGHGALFSQLIGPLSGQVVGKGRHRKTFMW